MQLHYGAKRENNELVFKSAGANAGIDCINPKGFVAEVADFMNALNREGNLPKTIIYSLNPTDNALIGTMDVSREMACAAKSSRVLPGGSMTTNTVWKSI